MAGVNHLHSDEPQPNLQELVAEDDQLVIVD